MSPPVDRTVAHRRSILGTVASVGVAVIGGCSTSTSREPSVGWEPGERRFEQFHVDAANSGCRPTGAAPRGRVTTQWVAETGGGHVSAPVVADGTVFVAADTGRLYALDERDGSLRWERAIRPDGGGVPSPAVLDGTVYVAVEGTIRALDAGTGEDRWVLETADRFIGPPTVSGGVLYVGGIDRDPSYLHAVDVDTGERRWRFDIGRGTRGAPGVRGGRVYVGSNDFELYAVDADTGEERYRASTASARAFGSAPSVVGDAVYVGNADGRTYVLDADTGQIRTAFETDGWTYPSPAVAEGTVCQASFDGVLYAFDRSEETVRWRFDSMIPGPCSEPIVVDDAAFNGALDGTVYAFDLESGDRLWSFDTGAAAVGGGLAVVNGAVYVGDAEGRVRALTDPQ